MSNLLWSRQPFFDIHSDAFFSQMKTWVNTCLNKHGLCRSDGGSVWETLTGSYRKRDRLAKILPTRVIDVENNARHPSLFTTNGASGQWVALSHCWGDHQPLKLESTSLLPFTNSIPFDTMPAMFQDAITITKRLGFRYLWIDCLCIIQDSHEDWLTESLKMGDIYKNAVVTLAAEAAKDGAVGILTSTGKGRFQLSDGEYEGVIQLSSQSSANSIKGSVVLLCSRSMVKVSSAAISPLSQRKWVLQEEMLSTRILRFAEGQVWWQCRELQCNERFPFGHRIDWATMTMRDFTRDLDENKLRVKKNIEWSQIRSFNLTNRRNSLQRQTLDHPVLVDIRHVRDFWYGMVNEYCNRRITYDTDLLPAISGIAKEYQRQFARSGKTNTSYKAGIWLEDLPQGLLWHTLWPGATLTSTYVAPSWSWASLRSGSYYNRRLLTDLVPDEQGIRMFSLIKLSPLEVATIRNIELKMRQDDVFGQVESGFLTLKGPCQDICRCSIPPSFLDCFSDGGDYILTYTNVQKMFKSSEDAPELAAICTVSNFAGRPCTEDEDSQHTQCLVAHIISSKRLVNEKKIAFALILEPAEDNDGNYRRIGLAILLEDVKSSKIWPTREITVV